MSQEIFLSQKINHLYAKTVEGGMMDELALIEPSSFSSAFSRICVHTIRALKGKGGWRLRRTLVKTK